MLTKTPQEISREYYQFAENFTQTDFEDEKFLGKFYTDYDIANKMMQILCKNYILNPFSSDIRIIDPFCGDGRLIISLLAELLKNPMLSCKKIFISIWDIDDVAVKEAKHAIEVFCISNKMQYEIDFCKTDAFVECENIQGTYDICVTNPPWGLLKPQKLFSKSNGKDVLNKYR